MINNQLDTGDIEMPTIATAVQDSGAIDVTIDEQDENGEMEVPDGNRTDAPAIGVIVPKQVNEAIEATTDESERHCGIPTEVLVGNRSGARLKNGENRMPNIVTAEHDGSNEYHQGTQTEWSTILSMADIVADESVKQKLF